MDYIETSSYWTNHYSEKINIIGDVDPMKSQKASGSVTLTPYLPYCFLIYLHIFFFAVLAPVQRTQYVYLSVSRLCIPNHLMNPP